MDGYTPINTSETQYIDINYNDLQPTNQEFVHPLLRLFMQSLLEIPQEDLQDIEEESFQEQKILETPCSLEFINKLEELEIIQSDIEEKLSCAICQEEFKLGEKVVGVPCSPMPHYFHIENTNCGGIIPWLKKNNTCPICRTEFPKEETIDEDGKDDEEEDDEEQGDEEEDDEEQGDEEEDDEGQYLFQEDRNPINFPDHRIITDFLQIIVNAEVHPINITNEGFDQCEVDEAIRRSLE